MQKLRRASSRRYTLAPAGHRVARDSEEDSRWNPDRWRRRPAVRRGPGLGPGRQGPEDRRARLRVERRHRRRLDGAGLQPGRVARASSSRVAGIGLQAPAILLVAFVPMLLIAASYYYMNRADPDCGTTFSWVTRAMGPYAGLARRLGDHRRRHHRHGQPGADRRPLLASCSSAGRARRTRRRPSRVVGHRLDRDHDRDLRHRHRAVGAHAGRPARRRDPHAGALRRRRAGQGRGRHRRPQRGRPQPLVAQPVRASTASTPSSSGVLLSRLHLLGLGQHGHGQRGEPRTPHEAPGRAAVVSTLSCSAIYVVVAVAAQAYGGAAGAHRQLRRRASACSARQVFGSPLDKLLIIAVLTSAAASTQTTILPTARTSLSMARARAMPESLGRIHPRFLTPHVSTISMGVAVDRLVRRADDRQREHPLRLDRRARPDDRLLLRAHRLRVRHLLPPRAAQQRAKNFVFIGVLPVARRR